MGENTVFDMGVEVDAGVRLPPSTAAPGDLGFPCICDPHVSMAKPLHQGAPPDRGLLEAKQGGIRFQAERERVGASNGDLGCKQEPTVP